MHLLETSNVKLLKDVSPDNIPEYAILSHTWSEGEVLFADMENGTALSKPGYQKIVKCCEQARKDGFLYIWIDTCCINKDSSAELSEAINSMFTLYHNAEVCYAYLEDVSDDSTVDSEDFARSRWFKRGWTLQELIAPYDLHFFSRNWQTLGQKRDHSHRLSLITGIDDAILRNERGLRTASIAQRMCWASGRATTRPEDMAYCLMGIFSVNMPMLYGEGGRKAFTRLQEEIMKETIDQSIFAWTTNVLGFGHLTGLLAAHPSCFADCADIVPYSDFESQEPFQVTNKGVEISLLFNKTELQSSSRTIYRAGLWCACPKRIREKGATCLAIFTEKLPESGQYARICPEELTYLDGPVGRKRVYVHRGAPASASVRHLPLVGLKLNGDGGYELRKVFRLCYPHNISWRPDKTGIYQQNSELLTLWNEHGGSDFLAAMLFHAKLRGDSIVVFLRNGETTEKLGFNVCFLKEVGALLYSNLTSTTFEKLSTLPPATPIPSQVRLNDNLLVDVSAVEQTAESTRYWEVFVEVSTTSQGPRKNWKASLPFLT